MADQGDDSARLFSPGDVLTAAELTADRNNALQPGEVERSADLDAARLWLSANDGLLVRGVKPHSAQKSRLVGRGIGTVSKAMGSKWFARKFGLQYLELYSGPGRLLDESTGTEQLGSPLQALELTQPFTRSVFSDFSLECTQALKKRVGPRTDAIVLNGDANHPAHLDHVGSYLDPSALVVAYLDPARPRDLRWSTVEHLARRFGYIDLIINVPVNSLMRAILGARAGEHAGPGAAGRFLGHEQPHELLRYRANGRLSPANSITEIRRHYDAQLQSLGFLVPARRTVEFPASNPYYDVLLVSRHPTGVDLWNKSNPVAENPQLAFPD